MKEEIKEILLQYKDGKNSLIDSEVEIWKLIVKAYDDGAIANQL